MALPLDFSDDLPPIEIVKSVPNRAALERVYQAVDGISAPDQHLDLEDVVGHYNPIETRKLVSQIEFAHQNHIHYYRVPGIGRVSFEETAHDADETARGMRGPETTWVIEKNDRTYLGCSVPEESGQLQFGQENDNRKTAIAVVTPGSDLLAIRAPSSGAAADAHRAVVEGAGPSMGEKLPSTVFETLFAAQAIESYREVTFSSTAGTSPVDDLTISTEYTSEVDHELLEDSIVQSLGDRHDIQLDRSRVNLAILSEEIVTISYRDSSIEFQRFVPESWLLAVDDAVAAAMPE